MSKTLKKLLAAVLAVLMVVSLAACAKTPASSTAPTPSNTESKADGDDLYYNKTGLPITKDMIEISVIGVKSELEYKWEDTLQAKDWEEKFNISVKSDLYNGDDLKTIFTQLAASDELPDLINKVNLTEAEAQAYGKDGYLLDFTQYKDLMPEMYARFKDYPAYQKYLSDEEGHIYGLSTLLATEHEALARVYMSQKWLDNLGLEVPTNTDELYSVLTEFKNKDANKNGDATDEIPFLFYGSGYLWKMFMPAYGILSKDYDFPLVVNNDKVEFAASSDNYKAMLKYLRKLYQDGLIDSGAFIDTSDDMKAKAKYELDRVGMLGDAPFLGRSSTIDKDQDMVWIGGLTSEVNDKQYVGISTGVQTPIIMMVSAKTEYPEAMARWIDYYYSDEGYVDGISGPLGVSWEYVEDAKTGYKIRKLLRTDEFDTDEKFRYNYATPGSPFTMFQNYEFLGRGVLWHLDDEKLKDQEVLDTYGWAAITELGMRREGNIMVYDFYPVMSYTADESTQRTTMKNDISTYLQTYVVTAITDKAYDIDAGWNAHLEELKKAKVNELLELEQKAYNRFNAGA